MKLDWQVHGSPTIDTHEAEIVEDIADALAHLPIRPGSEVKNGAINCGAIMIVYRGAPPGSDAPASIYHCKILRHADIPADVAAKLIDEGVKAYPARGCPNPETCAGRKTE